MLDSLTILSKTGLVLYHQNIQAARSSTSTSTSTSSSSTNIPTPATLDAINAFLSDTVLDRNAYSKVRKSRRVVVSASGSGSGSGSAPTVVVEWEEMSTVLDGAAASTAATASADSVKRDWMAVVTYPEVLARTGTSHQQRLWIRHFLRTVLREYGLYYDATVVASSSTSSGAAAVAASNMQFVVPDPTRFDATCRALLRRSENLGRRGAGGGGGAGGGDVPASFGEGVDYDDGGDDDINDNDDNSGDAFDENEEANIAAEQEDDVKARESRARAALKNRRRGATNHEATKTATAAGTKKGKEERVWHDGKGKMTKSAMKNLDRSKGLGAGDINGIDAAIAEDSAALAEARAAYLPTSDEVPAWEVEDVLIDDDVDVDVDGDDEDEGASGANSGGWGSSLKGLFDQMSGNKVLTKEDLDAPLDEMKAMLTSKNVANEVAAEICDSVRDRLVGKKMTSFGRVKTAVRHALEAAVEKVLKPAHGRDVDVLHSVVSKRERGSGGAIAGLFGGGSSNNKSNRPYTIVFVGINGVGKSTSLAKIAYYLKSNGCSPLLAACDTFRSGAVEQLNVHAKCLDVPLYHKGYAKDPSAVAAAAINHATEEGNDVVLVDTAGRMQNNVPLMKALSKLVVENQPDLVLFVCEALVGNDGMDQLHMFNKALRTGGHSRQIDGIVLTKFDTVSDKVGAALTMTHITGAPVVFVGTGQKYNHLKKLSVQSVIKSLFA